LLDDTNLGNPQRASSAARASLLDDTNLGNRCWPRLDRILCLERLLGQRQECDGINVGDYMG
jgi:hypothetical protein